MFDASAETVQAFLRDRGFRPDSVRAAAAGPAADAEAVARHFRENHPVLLDGALTRRSGRRRLVRQARETLARGRIDPDTLPAEILRETLDAIHAPENLQKTANPAKPDRKAGLVAVGPANARIWWDRSILENLEDVLSRLERPRSVLRFYDVTGLDPESGRWHDAFDIDVNVSDSGHTAHSMRGDKTYIVDLGYVHGDGRFLRLARTNTAALPRDGRGAPDEGETAACILRPRNRREEAALAPDAEAREWAAGRPDFPGRDIEAEAVVRMLYRAFLTEGPRALRRAARTLARRDAATLEREYAERRRERERFAEKLAKAKERPATGTGMPFLVARLDTEKKTAKHSLSAAANAPAEPANRLLPVLLRTAKTMEIEPVRAGNPVQDNLVRVVSDRDPDFAASLYSAPVFATAKSLRERIKNIPSTPAKPVEAKRMARAGVRITRTALTLEGRMRPGARLKVAGKLVRADANGRFRLECVLERK